MDRLPLGRACATCGAWTLREDLRDGCYCTPCGREYQRRYRAANRDKLKAYHREWERNNKDRKHDYGKKYRAANADKEREKLRRWREDNPEKWKAQYHNHRASIEGLEGSFTAEEWVQLCAALECRCARCGRLATEQELTVDHIAPLSMGGSNYIENIQPLCGPCNSSKGTQTIDYR